MGGVPAGSDTFFSVSPANASAFAIERGKLAGLGKINSDYYHPERTTALRTLGASFAKYAAVQLADVVTFERNQISPPSGNYLSLAHVQSHTGDLTDATDTASGNCFTFQADDVLFARLRPYLNKVYCAEADGCCSTEFYVLRVKDRDILLPEYLAYALRTSVVLAQTTHMMTGNTHPRVAIDDAVGLTIPLPSLDEQERLIAAMDAARNSRQAKLAEAESSLAGIDDFVLDALGIAPPAVATRRVFAVSVGQMQSSGRIDSDYYHPERTGALRLLDAVPPGLAVSRLDDVVGFARDQIDAPGDNYLGMAQVSSHTGELTGATDTASGKCFLFEPDDVLFSRMAPVLNKVYCAEMPGCCTTEFHVLRVKDKDTLLPEYLAAILRSRIIRSQTVHMTTGSTRPRLSNNDVANLPIPIPGLEIQGIIADEIGRRRNAARRLRVEAAAGWQAAREWFEGELLLAQ